MNDRTLALDGEKITAAARSWIGTRYRHQAASRELGIDCVQLIIEVGRAAGVESIPSIGAYRQINSPRQSLALLENFCIRVEPQTGSILFWGSRENVPTHFGIQTLLDGDMAIVHADAQLGRVVEQRMPHDQRRLIHSHWWFR